MNHYLSLVLFTPLIGALMLLLVPKQNQTAIRWVANITATKGLLSSITSWCWFNSLGGGYHFR